MDYNIIDLLYFLRALGCLTITILSITYILYKFGLFNDKKRRNINDSIIEL